MAQNEKAHHLLYQMRPEEGNPESGSVKIFEVKGDLDFSRGQPILNVSIFGGKPVSVVFNSPGFDSEHRLHGMAEFFVLNPEPKKFGFSFEGVLTVNGNGTIILNLTINTN
jgi:hypothetical protein